MESVRWPMDSRSQFSLGRLTARGTAKLGMAQCDIVVWIAAGILILLFGFQRFGTDKVAYTFSPVLLLWVALISGIGIYNFVIYDPTIIRAVNPWEIVEYFKRNGKEAWISLGSTVMCITVEICQKFKNWHKELANPLLCMNTTVAEALFADLGHFSVRSIQLSTCCIVYPAVMIAYTGQAAYLYMHPNSLQSALYDSVPKLMYWPMFAVAILASIIASQAMISGTFSIIQQSLSLGCFPRVKVVHTSDKFEGQVYIPEFNYLLMICCVLVTLGFKTTKKIGNAYGIAVVFVLFITSMFMLLVMILIWKTNIILIRLYTCTFTLIELVYLSAVLYKFPHGGFLPLAFAAFLMAIMFIWNYAYRKKYHYEMENKVSTETVKEIVSQKSFSRLPGLAIFYSELVHGIPPIFDHYVGNVPALHSVVVFVSIKSLPVSKVPVEERFLFRRVYPRDLYVFRCVARYGYIEVRDEQESIESMLIEKLKDFIRDDIWMRPAKKQVEHHDHDDKEPEVDSIQSGHDDKEITRIKEEEMEREMEVIDKACHFGIVHMMGESEVVSEKGSNLGKRFVIDFGYNFLKRILRQTDKLFDIPRKRLLKVGMMYEL
ncbi:hypothetical protein Cgig2_017712 [Carnegiea gigantea]|uniref:Potassium transporter n=1 Tax=Carnegiea gigantea TaxID=171969 RepID=A0A9Q1QB53_9CARY|nr:hypothetical protein Cgig2_017712 [Carnegiea gigantea]